MAEGITTVRIFIASSIDELHEDRMALGDYVRKLNDIYMERGVYFRLFMCEDESAAMADSRKQDELNRQLRGSQLCFVIVFDRMGRYTLEEFEIAYGQMKATGSPALVTCFRQQPGHTPQQSALDFMKRLDEELGHFYTMYGHIDSLKLKLLMQIKLLDLDVPVELRDGRALVGGVEALTLENIPAFVRNADLRRLRDQYEAAEREFQAAKARYLANPDDDGGFLAAGARRQEARKAVEALEQVVVDLLLGAERASKQRITPREREAYALVEQGRSAEASAILDGPAILAEAEKKERLAEAVRESIGDNVRELLLKANIEKTLVGDPGRFDRIIEIYEAAVALEERNGLKKVAMREYCGHLFNQRDFRRAAGLVERYGKYMELEGAPDGIADASNMLGVYYNSVGRRQEAVAAFERAEALQEKLAAEGTKAQLYALALTCNNLGVMYGQAHRAREAEAKHLRAKEIRERLAAKDPAYLFAVAMSCVNLGVLYRQQGRVKEAEAECRRAVEIQEKLAAEDPGKYLPDLPMMHFNLAGMYAATDRPEQAEAAYRRAKEIQEKLADENPQGYLADLARTCGRLAELYASSGRAEAAVGEYLRARDACQALERRAPGSNLPDLAVIHFQLGELYGTLGRPADAEPAYLRAREYQERLAAENPAESLPGVASVCYRLAGLYLGAGRLPEAEAEYLRAKAAYGRLARGNRAAYPAAEAKICACLGDLYIDMQRPKDAEAQYRRARELYEQMAQAQPGSCLVELINLYNNMAYLYYRILGDEEQALALLEKKQQLELLVDQLRGGR